MTAGIFPQAAVGRRPVVAHMTTVHPRDDARIRLKEVATLAGTLDADVRLYVQDGEGEAAPAGAYRVVDTGPRLSRLLRMTLGAWRMMRAVRRAHPVVVHFHDPELLPWAMVLRLTGTKVVYDVHEDVPRQILHNTRIPVLVRRTLSPIVAMIEWVATRFFDGVVAATPEIASRFPPKSTALVRNYPLIEEFAEPGSIPMRDRAPVFVYVGGLTRNRGLAVMVNAVERFADHSAVLRLAGEFATGEDRAIVEACARPAAIQHDGWVGRDAVAAMLSTAKAGLVTLLPIRAYVEARPVKMFEYMAAGLPVIASDFPRWREIVEDAACGLLVDPTDPDAIADAMQWIIDHPDEAATMGRKGREAIEKRYSWSSEAAALTALYRPILRRQIN